MPVNGYIIHKKPGSSNLPRHFLASTGPYLFRAEAERLAQAITDGTGIDCHVSIIPVQRLLDQQVMIDNKTVVTSIWEIAARDEGFCGKAFVEGNLHPIQRNSADQSWRILTESQNHHSDKYLTLVA